MKKGLGKKNILIIGLPGVGKTTLIKKIAEKLKDLHTVGFYTAEIREGGVRKGFELISLDGKKGLLSHTEIKSPHRVGKYGVDVGGLEGFLDSVDFLNPHNRIVIIDEIGKMECYSEKFRRLIKELLNSGKMVISTISSKGGGLIGEIKKRDDIMLFEVTYKNRDALVSEILEEAGVR
ncbi:MAG: NTPase [Nitrospira sp.]|nr:NTPase [Nitrospira sp.]